MRISDWSSDVCSSDLLLPGLLVDQPDQGKLRPPQVASLGCQTFHIACSAYADQRVRCAEATRAPHTCRVNDRSAIIGPTSRYATPATSGLERKSVGSGKGGSVRVNFGGGRILK